MKKLFAVLITITLSIIANANTNSFISMNSNDIASAETNFSLPFSLMLMFLFLFPILVSYLIIQLKSRSIIDNDRKNEITPSQKNPIAESSQIKYLTRENSKLEEDLDGLYFLWQSAKDELQVLQNKFEMTNRLPNSISKKIFQYENKNEKTESNIKYISIDSIQSNQPNP